MAGNWLQQRAAVSTLVEIVAGVGIVFSAVKPHAGQVKTDSRKTAVKSLGPARVGVDQPVDSHSGVDKLFA